MAINQDSSYQPANENTVWSDLRAIRFISQLQMEVQSLKVSNSRLRMLFALSVTLLGSGLVTLAYCQIKLYEQFEQNFPPSQTNSTLTEPNTK